MPGEQLLSHTGAFWNGPLRRFVAKLERAFFCTEYGIGQVEEAVEKVGFVVVFRNRARAGTGSGGEVRRGEKTMTTNHRLGSP